MSFLTELKAGKLSIYGQWMGWLSALRIVVTLVEFTFLAKCIRGTDRLIALSENMKFKAIGYKELLVQLFQAESNKKVDICNLEMLAAKKALRKEMKAILKKVPQQVVEHESQVISQKLLAHPVYIASKSVSIFLNMPGEVETFQILQDIFANGKACFIPMCSEKMDMVQLKSIDDFHSLKKNSWGIPEPLPEENRLNVEQYKDGLDLVIMPGLAFDKQGHRMGYGKGYYDKFLSRSFELSQLNGTAKPKTIAVCQSAQIVDSVPTADYDIKPDYIITA
ncbi:hypothetical protein HDV01_004993 [Terramyces sp. JEL0728]|nr:hypothetical protein HDV01_004993 [Terramyces sp. JEL0728]